MLTVTETVRNERLIRKENLFCYSNFEKCFNFLRFWLFVLCCLSIFRLLDVFTKDESGFTQAFLTIYTYIAPFVPFQKFCVS